MTGSVQLEKAGADSQIAFKMYSQSDRSPAVNIYLLETCTGKLAQRFYYLMPLVRANFQSEWYEQCSQI